MGVSFFLLPKVSVVGEAAIARDWLDREHRRFAETPLILDPAIEIRKRKFADLLLEMKPDFQEFEIRHEELAKFEKISLHDARLMYRFVEVNGPGVQFTIFDQHIQVGVYSTIDAEELDALLAALAAAGEFVLYNPQSDAVIDLTEESFG